MRASIILLLSFCSAGAWAGIYKWVDADGRVHYSDQQVEQATEIRVPGGARPSGNAPVPHSADAPNGDSANGAYQQFQLLEPEENQTFRTDEGRATVAILLQPALLPEHEIRLIMDGTEIAGRFTTTSLILNQIPRGSHRLMAKIVDRDGETVASTGEVNFHVRKAAESPAAP